MTNELDSTTYKLEGLGKYRGPIIFKTSDRIDKSALKRLIIRPVVINENILETPATGDGQGIGYRKPRDLNFFEQQGWLQVMSLHTSQNIADG